MTEPDLKPCPFCGGEVTTGKLIHTITHVDNEVKCPIEGMGFTNVTLWNTRATPTTQEAAQVLFEDPKAVRRLAAGGITGGSCGVSAILRAMAKEQAGS